MYRGKSRRRHERHKVEQITPIQLNGSDGTIFFVVPVDESESGLGCIYSGKIPPEAGRRYMVARAGETREMELRWISPLSKNRYRLGLMYADMDLDG
ncbi:MAG: hypothetical protein RQ753_00935 [Desulfurivibrionaceae bacterium]|nr:hypothetical protein [Desulfurivibrionaceae bacterium]